MQRYCKHIFALNISEVYPYTFRGSGTALRFGDQHFLFCCGHQFPDYQPDDIAFRPLTAPDKIVTGSSMSFPTVTKQNHEDDAIDLRGFEFHVDKYAIANFTSDFFRVDVPSLWPKGSLERHRFFVFGYPFSRQEVDYLTPKITARVTCVGGTYDGRSASPGVHRLKMERTEQFDTDGFSGGPVFYVGREAGIFFIGFAGIVIRGGKSSDTLHFVDAEYICHFAELVPNSPISA